MRHKLNLLLLMLFCVALVGSVEAQTKYGKKLTLKTKTKVSAILENPKAFDGKLVQVDGLILDVCPKRGCWIKIGSDKEFESIQFKVDDGVIVFPMEAKGKKVTAEGTIFVKEYTREELIEQARHHAEEQGKLDTFDPSTIEGSKTVIRINGEGATIK